MKALFYFFLLLFTFTQNSAQSLESYPRPFSMPISLSWQNSEGKPVSIQNFENDVVLLHFWATWCVPCVYELPMFNSLQERYDTAGFKVIAITSDDTMDKVQDFYKRYDIQNLEIFTSHNKILQSALNVKNLPTTFLLNRKHEVIATKEGVDDWLGDDVRVIIEQTLKSPRQEQKNRELPEIIDGNVPIGIRY